MSTAASASDLLEDMSGYDATPRRSELPLRFHDRDTRSIASKPQYGHLNDPAIGFLWRGDTVLLLEPTGLRSSLVPHRNRREPPCFELALECALF